jgi:glycosyltransferase involved in cell wall biosynthesis
MLLASVYRQPVACTHHTYARRTRLYRWASRLPRFHTVVLTPNMARHYRLTVNPPRVSVISACCAEALFEFPLERRVRSRSAGQPLRLVGAGNLVRWKRWHLMLDAFARLSPSERTQLHFTHFGEAPPDPDSMAYAQSLHHRVRSENLESCIDFAGPSLDAPQRIREADWFVLPSTNEPCSVALIEALALGKPALVSASGGNLDIVTRDRTGLLFKPDDPEDLVRNLRRIVANAIPLADPLEIRQSVAHRRASVVAGLYQELYERIVSGSIARHTPAATP